jgi:hypothetical protein
MTEVLSSVLPQYLFALGLLLGLVIEALINYKRYIWSLPALAIYATIFVWYYTELIYTPENFVSFSQEIIGQSYDQIFIFLASFRLFIPWLSRKFSYNSQLKWSSSVFHTEQLLFYSTIIWGLLLVYGIIRMNGDVFGALFPLKSRAGVHMWARAAASGAGSTGFLVSAASYTYLLVCSFFGVLLPLQTKTSFKIINTLLMLTALPYFLLMGARNQVLAVLFPAYFSYLLFARRPWWLKAALSVIAFFILNQVLTFIISYRNIGFEMLLNVGIPTSSAIAQQEHKGLNMLEELCHINSFFQQGMLESSYGGRYVEEFLNFIPRAIWPDKPLLGIDYAKLRGFGSKNSDIGVYATISTGFIGQGILNFGPWLGSIAPGFLMAAWSGWLSRLWVQRYSALRLCLFLAALGVTFNLGRDFTLLVLFPIVFGYVLVRLLENLKQKTGNSSGSSALPLDSGFLPYPAESSLDRGYSSSRKTGTGD